MSFNPYFWTIQIVLSDKLNKICNEYYISPWLMKKKFFERILLANISEEEKSKKIRKMYL